MDNYVIDREQLDEQERALFDKLVAKALVDPKAAQEELEGQEPPATPPKKKPTEEDKEVIETKKNAPAEPEVPQFVKDAIAKSEEFIEGVQKKEMIELAKKYDILGQKPEELGAQLYALKKSDEEMYKTCISMLDGQLALIEKSPAFAEIGKSGHRGNSVAGGTAEDKIEAKAREIMKADPHISRTDAIAKAWVENPNLAAEYDAEYFGN